MCLIIQSHCYVHTNLTQKSPFSLLFHNLSKHLFLGVGRHPALHPGPRAGGELLALLLGEVLIVGEVGVRDGEAALDGLAGGDALEPGGDLGELVERDARPVYCPVSVYSISP